MSSFRNLVRHSAALAFGVLKHPRLDHATQALHYLRCAHLGEAGAQQMARKEDELRMPMAAPEVPVVEPMPEPLKEQRELCPQCGFGGAWCLFGLVLGC